MADLKQLADSLVNLTVKEVQELATILKDEHGIEPAAAAPVMMAGGGGSAAPAEAEKTAFDVVMLSAGGTKLNVVKAVKDITNLGLKEAKDLVDAGNGVIKEKISKADAETVAKQLTEAGAEVEIKQ